MPSPKNVAVSSSSTLSSSAPPIKGVAADDGAIAAPSAGNKKVDKSKGSLPALLRRSVLVTPLPVDLRTLYARIITRFFPDAVITSQWSKHREGKVQQGGEVGKEGGNGMNSSKQEKEEEEEEEEQDAHDTLLMNESPSSSTKPEGKKGQEDVAGSLTDDLDSAGAVGHSTTTEKNITTSFSLEDPKGEGKQAVTHKGKENLLWPASSFSPQSSLFSNVEVINNDAESAILLLQVPSREAAQKMFRRLHNARVCDRRWKVQYMPASLLKCSTEPCLVECTLVPPATVSLAEEVLKSIPGYLAIAKYTPVTTIKGGKRGRAEDEVPEEEQEEKKKKRKRREDGSHADEEVHVSKGETGDNELDDILVESVLATFCDEGSALHARAVLSGRMVGDSSGARMFVKVRTPSSMSKRG